MAASTDLFDLVHSLNRSEKRYFTMFVDMQSGDKVYMKLFRELDRMDSYDEALLKSKFKGEACIKEFHVTKNYLYNLIFRSMRIYYENRSMETRIKNIMLDIRFLEQKGLYKQCRKLIKRIKKLAREHERFLLLIEIILWEKRISLNDDNYEQDILQLHNELSEIRKANKNKLDFILLKDKLFIKYRRQRNLRDPDKIEKLKRFLDNSLMHERSRQDSDWSRYLHKNIMAFYHHILGDLEEANKYYESCLQIWDQNPKLVKENPRQYKIVIYNFLNSCHSIGKYDDFERLFKKSNVLKSGYIADKAADFINVTYLQLLMHMNKQEYNKADLLLPQIETKLKTYQAFLSSSRKLAFMYNIAMLKFILKQYNSSLDWVMRILNQRKSEVRQDIRCMCQILQLILHVELGNYQYVDNLSSTVYKQLRKQDYLHEFERTLLRNIKKVPSLKDVSEEKRFYRNFAEKVNVLNRQSHRSLGYDEVKMWLEGKI